MGGLMNGWPGSLALASINEVTLSWAQLLLWQVTVHLSEPGSRVSHLGTGMESSHLGRLTSSSLHMLVKWAIEYQLWTE